MNFNQFAFDKFGNFVSHHDRYLKTRGQLRSAHIFKPYEEYISEAIAISIIAAIATLIIGTIIGIIITTLVDLPPLMLYNPGAAEFLRFFTPYKDYILIVLTGVVSSVVLMGLIYSVFMIYPSAKANIRKVKIETQLPSTITYMYALSKGETNIIEIIRSIAELSNVYGEISHEFAIVLRDTELLGADFMTALKNLQMSTPSPSFSQFIGNLITLIDNGGDIPEFLEIQIDSYRRKTKSEHSLFLDMLGMIAESYVTGFVAAPLFILIVAVTLGAMKGSMTGLLLSMTYVIIPFSSIAFIFLIDLMLPKDEQIIGSLSLKKVKKFVGLRVAEIPAGNEQELFDEYEKAKKRLYYLNIIKHPLNAFHKEPALSFYISIPAAIVALAIPTLSNQDTLSSGYAQAFAYLTDYILLAVIIALIPYIVFYEIRAYKMRKIERAIPHFLKNLSIINETGVSLSESLRILLRSESGALRFHIERMYTDISWGASTKEAFTRFANKLKINMLSRLTALITKASESSGDIREVLDIASIDTNINLQLKKDKFTNMLIYVIIIYVTFLVYLYIVHTLATSFLPQMAAAGQVGGGFVRNFDLAFYEVYFYHTVLIQGFFSGMMAGVLGEGDPRLGFKHSLIMMLIAFASFKILVIG
ncbi:MAG: hypothetical protein HF976_13450 [ANME-2 cluster archaeon]|nr:hypothetical protein [ANME-2 cluster archaeon]MBC2702383.1 hypothetical protein [ANME-2 cluster archaeon]MBC2708620.1 hypothetical protein [ANME-2 cluster archaeon]MBC2745833.1 hypothetical protein [ANME-2 cluster archaeon]